MLAVVEAPDHITRPLSTGLGHSGEPLLERLLRGHADGRRRRAHAVAPLDFSEHVVSGLQVGGLRRVGIVVGVVQNPGEGMPLSRLVRRLAIPPCIGRRAGEPHSGPLGKAGDSPRSKAPRSL